MSAATLALLAAAGILAVGTLALRLAGVVLSARISPSERVQEVLDTGVTVLFCALIATAALVEAQEFVGWARPIGVAVGGVLAWRRAPFVVVVVAAAATAALLRLIGVP
ncbi:branched-subunit amino acid transport protein AzlD [Labedella gwakjiensis]|uniref:AzlD domain-containing protein n=1 Tax=Labedella gwakjiensis TaxID=390269 RepID=A0A2P8GVN2_9MICO|nr:AzlD domain-containing protein [Labedella gwakjiensis]PSL38030.1 branched-subunit amino acid transport protein AzlD [Labedella gwakjiensis]RUQ87409.1 AzlD domain-containing protein [Labedella gwakjiensis]